MQLAFVDLYQQRFYPSACEIYAYFSPSKLHISEDYRTQLGLACLTGRLYFPRMAHLSFPRVLSRLRSTPACTFLTLFAIVRARSLTFKTVVGGKGERKKKGIYTRRIGGRGRNRYEKGTGTLIDSSASSLSASRRPTGTNELGTGGLLPRNLITTRGGK